VLLVLMLGAFEIGTYVLDRTVAAQAARQGARLAGELGSGPWDPSEPGPNQSIQALPEDTQIVEAVLAITGNSDLACQRNGGMRNFRLDYVIISDGEQPPDIAKTNAFDGCGRPALSNTYTRPDRKPVPPYTRRIRVTVKWSYYDPGSMFTALFQARESPGAPPGQFSETTIMPIAPPVQ
jgi:hypothetical protein